MVGILQRAVLVPLELALLAGDVPEPVTPGQLGVLVVARVLPRANPNAHPRRPTRSMNSHWFFHTARQLPPLV